MTGITVPASTTLAFDLDGTLIDTAPDLLATLDAILGQAGHGPVPPERIRPQIAAGARAMLTEGFAHHGASVADEAMATHYRAYLVHYEANIARHSRPFEKLLDLLDVAKAAGCRLAVCTNKQERLARLLLDQLGLTPLFDAVAGGDTYGVSKPDPAHLVRTVEDAGGDIRRTVFFGDSDVDVATARAAGVPVVGVTFGYTPVAMAELRPDLLVEHYGDVNLDRVLRLLDER